MPEVELNLEFPPITPGEAFDAEYEPSVLFGEPAPEPEPVATVAPAAPKAIRTMEEMKRDQQFKPNDLGVTFDPKTDTCYNLNSTWGRGVCVAQGNIPCPYLGGNCEMCQLFVDKDAEFERRKNLPPHERYANG